MLVADIMVRHNLDIYRVRGHHAFTAKNCPQPMLENDLEIWWKFIELVEAEYEKLVSYNNTNVLIVPLTDAINDHGRVITNESNSALMYKLIDKVTNEEVILVSLYGNEKKVDFLNKINDNLKMNRSRSRYKTVPVPAIKPFPFPL